VIVIVFDAWSAYDLAMYGYYRETTPNIARLAKRGIVYHNHYAGGNFTTPGTASLMTGVLPWTHRAILPNSEVAEPYVTRNLFSAFPDHYRIAYTHNGWAYTLLRQFHQELDELIARESLLVGSVSTAIQQLLKNDDDIAATSWIRGMEVREEGFAYSLYLSQLYSALQEKKIEDLKPLFPRGIPTTSGSGDAFLLETAVDTLSARLAGIPQPFLGYFHFLPPHYPYRAPAKFVDAFKGDGYQPLEKPIDLFARKLSKNLPAKQREYDEFILYCDEQFGRMFDLLEASGLLENSWVVLTSDHGEMFERGISGHSTHALYEPVVKVPLVIFEPGRTEGLDIREYTSAVDVLPTLAHITGQAAPGWVDGVVMPPFASTDRIPARDIYLVRAVNVPQYAPLSIASIMQVRENYKLHYYLGYPEVRGGEYVKLFDTRADPDEMTDLAKTRPEIAADMLAELKARLKQADAPYL
jgi:arylsulfatase A-like enzyme